MTRIFTNAEYADMRLQFLRWCATVAVEEYRRRFHMRRIPDSGVSSKVFNTLRECGMLLCAHASSERAQHVQEQENILDMAERSPTTGMRRLSTRLGV